MDIPIYERLKEFKENYILDFTNNNETNFYQYLKNISNKYSKHISSEMNKNNKYYDELLELEYSILQKLESLIPSDAYLLLLHDLWSDYCNEDEDVIFENPKLFCDIIDFDWTFDSETYIHRFFEIKKVQKDFRTEQQEFTLKYLKIIRYIEDEKKEIENKIKQPQLSQSNIDLLTQTNEPDPLTAKQVEKIGLLIRSGFVDFLKEKNPKISDNQIAGFISLISDGTMKQSSINPNLKKENKNYPIKNQQDKNDLDYILEKYGISPQSE